MIDLRTLNYWLSRFTYKPGWRFSIRSSYMNDCPELLISHLATDAVTGKGAPMPIRSLVVLDMVRDYESFKYVLFMSIDKLERHELNEWFKEDGVCVNDPHPELKEKRSA